MVHISDKAIFHVHTYRCGHAEMSTDESYVKQAIQLGATEIWFTDHVPFPGIVSSTRMRYDQLSEYISSLQYLKNQYQGKIDIHIGMEIEYMPQFDAYYAELREMLEILVLGQHGYYKKEI